ncbi:alpha/beta hydrolase family protein [Nocardia sp. NPDC020380]|uniref:alpha/beta hydrolase family protein n=1 Tax=Nocardia sp. NPDC020380 TaxID=3364309 RepID=UPI0037B2D125
MTVSRPNTLHRLAFAVTAVSMMFSVDGTIAHATADSPPAVVISLPAPTGDLPVGVTEIRFEDSDRPDPWRADQRRELMVRIWYPAADSASAPTTPWITGGALQAQTSDLTDLGIDPDRWEFGPGHSQLDAPARTAGGPFPILLFSPGMDDPAGLSTAQAEDLASHGYIVAAINHTHEAFAVQFPDGRTERTVIPLDSPPEVLSDVLLPVRVADTRFVLNRLTDIATGTATAETVDLAPSLDPTRVGMFGHSLGGSTTAQAMHDDPRIRAGANLDGPLLGPVVADGLNRPLLMLGNDNPRWLNRENWDPFWPNNSGAKIPLRLSGTEHMSFNDVGLILPQLTTAGLLPATTTESIIGNANPSRSLDLQRTYLRTYFDLAFGRTDGNLPETITHLAQPGVYLHP